MPYPPNPKTLGDHLKKQRLDMGLRQKDVALRLAVNDWTICNWENNKTVPAVRYLPRIIAFLGYDPFPVPQSLGEEIVAARRKLGLSRKWLAKRLGMDEMTLARYETGAAVPQGGQASKLERFVADYTLAVSRAAD